MPDELGVAGCHSLWMCGLGRFGLGRFGLRGNQLCCDELGC